VNNSDAHGRDESGCRAQGNGERELHADQTEAGTSAIAHAATLFMRRLQRPESRRTVSEWARASSSTVAGPSRRFGGHFKSLAFGRLLPSDRPIRDDVGERNRRDASCLRASSTAGRMCWRVRIDAPHARRDHRSLERFQLVCSVRLQPDWLGPPEGGHCSESECALVMERNDEVGSRIY